MALLRLLVLAACAGVAVAQGNHTPPGFDASESGFLTLPDFNDVNLFYWLFKVRSTQRDPRM